jgi:tetratricopeptide (TPR) repeat protein
VPPSDIAAALRAGRWRAAHQACHRRLADDPDDAQALAGLAQIAEAHQNYGTAADLYGRARRSAAAGAGVAIRHARVLTLLRRFADAAAAADAALAALPDDPAELDTLGVVLSRLHRHEEAARLFGRATEGRPDNGPGWRNLGSALRFCGDFAGAERAYDRAIALDPHDAEAWLARVGLRPQTGDDDPSPTLQALWHRRGADPDEALRIGHALAKVAEDRGDPAAAMEWLARAKRAKAEAVRHDPDATDRLYAAAAQTCAAADLPATGRAGPMPILVVGAPRTGTTLVDRILSSHPAVTSVGESPALSLAVKRLSGTRSNRVLDAETLALARDLDMAAIGDAYLAALPPAERTVDKMPLNLLYAGLAHRALPDARIVRLRRHPIDTVLANWRQLFSPRFGHYDHNWTLDHVARWVVAVERLAAHWRAVLPPARYHEVGYEDLVTRPEATTRALLSAVALDWDPACLRPDRNRAPVATASAVQVRAPIHARSVGAWRGVAGPLAPAIAVLREAGLIDDDGEATAPPVRNA